MSTEKDKFYTAPCNFVEIFKLNCYDDPIDYGDIDSVSELQMSILSSVFEAICFGGEVDDRLAEIEYTVLMLIPYVVRRRINLELSFCKEDGVIHLALRCPLISFSSRNKEHFIRICETANRITFISNSLTAEFSIKNRTEN